MSKKHRNLKRLIHDMLDGAITYGEYILPKKTIEELADATNYTLPDRNKATHEQPPT